MFAEELRRAAEVAPLARLHEVSAALWKAFAAGGLGEAEAGAISELIEARKTAKDPAITGPAAPRRVGSRPRTDASMERRRRWAAAGRMPPQLAARFTLAEAAVLAVVAAETAKRGDCRLCHEHVAAVAGVSRTTVKAALRRARMLGLVTIEERRAAAWRNLANVVRIVSREWQAWMRLARRSPEPGGGGKCPPATNTSVQGSGRQRPAEAEKRVSGGRKAGRPREPGGGASRTDGAAGAMPVPHAGRGWRPL